MLDLTALDPSELPTGPLADAARTGRPVQAVAAPAEPVAGRFNAPDAWPGRGDLDTPIPLANEEKPGQRRRRSRAGAIPDNAFSHGHSRSPARKALAIGLPIALIVCVTVVIAVIMMTGGGEEQSASEDVAATTTQTVQPEAIEPTHESAEKSVVEPPPAEAPQAEATSQPSETTASVPPPAEVPVIVASPKPVEAMETELTPQPLNDSAADATSQQAETEAGRHADDGASSVPQHGDSEGMSASQPDANAGDVSVIPVTDPGNGAQDTSVMMSIDELIVTTETVGEQIRKIGTWNVWEDPELRLPEGTWTIGKTPDWTLNAWGSSRNNKLTFSKTNVVFTSKSRAVDAIFKRKFFAFQFDVDGALLKCTFRTEMEKYDREFSVENGIQRTPTAEESFNLEIRTPFLGQRSYYVENMNNSIEIVGANVIYVITISAEGK